MIFNDKPDPVFKNSICITEEIKICDEIKDFKKMVRQRGFEPPHP